MQVRSRTPVNPGIVQWSGDNPGIYLKEDDDGDWRRLALYFNLALSPHGRGVAMLVLSEPDLSTGVEAGNLCITSNRPLMQYLLTDFLAKFPTFRGRAALDALPILDMDAHTSSGNPVPGGECSEQLTSGDNRLTMTWRDIHEPFAVEVGPSESATGEHDMYAFFMEAGDATIAVNGKPLSGHVVNRPFFGTTMSSAFLAMSETWVAPTEVD